MKFTIEQMMDHLPLPADEKWKNGIWDLEPFSKNGVRLVFFAPKDQDFQTSHEQDEFYFIIRGTGEIVIAGQRQGFTSGDVFFVEAGVEHRFENFTADFATWAIFF